MSSTVDHSMRRLNPQEVPPISAIGTHESGTLARSLADFEAIQQSVAMAIDRHPTPASSNTAFGRDLLRQRRKERQAHEVYEMMAHSAIRDKVGYGATIDGQRIAPTTDDSSRLPISVHVHSSVLPAHWRRENTQSASDSIGQPTESVEKLSRAFANRARETLIINAAKGLNTCIDGPWLRERMVETLISSAVKDLDFHVTASGTTQRLSPSQELLSHLIGRNDLTFVHAIAAKILSERQKSCDPGFRPNPTTQHVSTCEPSVLALRVSPHCLARFADGYARQGDIARGPDTEANVGSPASATTTRRSSAVPPSTVTKAMRAHLWCQQLTSGAPRNPAQSSNGTWKNETDLLRILCHS
ncbi:hypothetical protein I316_06854 [Kwoniella heveanensis BCC8398]|uniref:Uncharacterized protein n=1 Tax=Kwoniella heveanensis BCC8398 TaxID=1296120 RepID=A0A1B9GK34_9TREE|nr:hypothetical protein I316_06854 [Kwoniella heveanensis BCC8398]